MTAEDDPHPTRLIAPWEQTGVRESLEDCYFSERDLTCSPVSSPLIPLACKGSHHELAPLPSRRALETYLADRLESLPVVAGKVFSEVIDET